jgi:hypothetical protein
MSEKTMGGNMRKRKTKQKNTARPKVLVLHPNGTYLSFNNTTAFLKFIQASLYQALPENYRKGMK